MLAAPHSVQDTGKRQLASYADMVLKQHLPLASEGLSMLLSSCHAQQPDCAAEKHVSSLQMCTDGVGCKRRVCFFAHAECELRKPEEDPVWLQQQMQAEMAAGDYRMFVLGAMIVLLCRGLIAVRLPRH